jgi:hypothetical protein
MEVLPIKLLSSQLLERQKWRVSEIRVPGLDSKPGSLEFQTDKKTSTLLNEGRGSHGSKCKNRCRLGCDDYQHSEKTAAERPEDRDS